MQEARKRETNVLTIDDIEKLGSKDRPRSRWNSPGKAPKRSTLASTSTRVDCGFVPGTGWPEPGGFLPREALKLLGPGRTRKGICGMEVVEVSPPYDTSDITALLGVRVVVEALGSMVANGKLGEHKTIIDKPVSY